MKNAIAEGHWDRARLCAAAVICLGSGLVFGQANTDYAVERQLQFISGDANMRAGLGRQPAVSELVAGEFTISVDDLDDDGAREIIVVGSGPQFCGSGGCLTVVLRNAGPGQLEPIFQQNLFPRLGVTREKENGYRLLAALDGKGRIARGEKSGTPLFGKPMVYAMTAASTAKPQATSAQPVAAPQASSGGGAAIDVLGMSPGKSSIADVRKALAAVQPALRLNEGQMRLAGRSATAGITRGPIEVGEGPFLRLIEAITHTSNVSARCGNIATQGSNAYCEIVRVSFSAPPTAGIAQVVDRDVYFGPNGPTFDNMQASLTSKYGPVGFQKAYGDAGQSIHMHWAWDAAGRPIPLNERHTCANDRVAIAAGLMLQEEQKRANVHVEAGCATTLKVQYGGRNRIVTNLKIVAVDHRSVRDLNTRTNQYVDELVAEVERKEREKAGAVATPKL